MPDPIGPSREAAASQGRGLLRRPPDERQGGQGRQEAGCQGGRARSHDRRNITGPPDRAKACRIETRKPENPRYVEVGRRRGFRPWCARAGETRNPCASAASLYQGCAIALANLSKRPGFTYGITPALRIPAAVWRPARTSRWDQARRGGKER
ncbi:Hypothetical protein A7982_10712 [Minicystis rosea]|nr:Hypothetical protein A7982_10712 [Minicystis rosea]